MTTKTERDRALEDAEWRCFHCGEVFTNDADARAHFGDNAMEEPGCKLNALEGGILALYRDAQQEIARYRREDHEAARTFYALGAEHYQALRREEEKGYARGLRDAGYENDQAATLTARVEKLEAANPDDIRSAGWSVAVHNDYRLNGDACTFWLFTKDGVAIKGEGRTDAEALNQVREALKPAATGTEGK